MLHALLLLAILSTRLLTAAESVTVAVTGDIYTPDAKVVSDAIMGRKPLDAVLLVGDTCNSSRSPIEEYGKLYRNTYDRFLPMIYPSPGNHDRYCTPRFAGYDAFWGAVAHAPKRYYSFNLGDWHIVSLDSVSFRDSKETPDMQLSWLKKDLAENPRKPIVAYWHYPYYSRANHLGEPKMKPLWQALEEHGPALLFCGHNHAYERFPPLNANGEKVPEAKGIQQFVISPGGASPIQEESPKATGPAAVMFHGGTQHVGFFTLKPGGAFSYSITSVNSQGETAEVDRGLGAIHPPR